MNPIECKFESVDFEAGIRRVLEITSRTAPVVVNQAALNVAGRALNNTPMTDKAGMVAQLGGQVATALRVIKSGKRKGQLGRGAKVYSTATLAAILVNAKRGAKGEKGLFGPAMRKAADALIATRKRSVGFAKTGWIPAIRTLSAVLPHPFIIARLQGISIIGQRKGVAVPAPRNSMTPVATIENMVKIAPLVGTRALEDAMNQEGRAMQAHADEEFRKLELQLK